MAKWVQLPSHPQTHVNFTPQVDNGYRVGYDSHALQLLVNEYTMAKPQFVSVPQAATALETTRQAVWRRVQRGTIPAMMIGNRYVIPSAVLMDLLKRKQPEVTA